MSQKIPVLTISRTPTVAVVANRFVGFDGNQITVAGARTLGVADMPTEAVLGRPIPIDVVGTSKVAAGAIFAAGIAIKSDANGRAIAQGGVGAIAGYSLDASVAVDDVVEVVLALA